MPEGGQMIWLSWRAIGIWGQFAAISGLVAMVITGAWYIHHKIYQSGYDHCQAEIAIFQTKMDKQHGEKEREILQLDDFSIDQRLARWMRRTD